MSRAALANIGKRCVLCTVVLTDDVQIKAGICDDCMERPEVKRRAAAAAAKPAAGPRPVPRPFTAADRALIQSMGALVPPIDLLRLLNVRLIADLGPDAPRYTPEQLQEELQRVAARQGDGAWAGLRRILADARRAGVLDRITAEVLDDFATVYQLTPAQHIHLRDVIRGAREGR
jgi:hypothetical protein